jgi:hypothetical protein
VLACVADDNYLVVPGKGDLLDVTGVWNLMGELVVLAGKSLTVETKKLNIVLHAHHHDDRISRLEVHG